MNQIESLLPLIPLLPLIGFLINGLFGRYFDRRLVAVIACGSLGASFLISVAAFIALSFPGADVETLSRAGMAVTYNWFTVGIPGGDLSLNFGFYVDNLTSIMLLVVTGVGLLIHIYSAGYMADDPGLAKFFAYLNLFCFSMLVLVMADNLVLLFVGWEGVGLCSYLLIGFWYTDMDKAKAGQKAFVTNRIGDAAVLLAMFLLVGILGTLSIPEINAAAHAAKPAAVKPHASADAPPTTAPIVAETDADGSPVAAEPAAASAAAPRHDGHSAPMSAASQTLLEWSWLIALLLFVGACGKSAQIPLHVWLPDAMAGPTPVSALIHAATMVTAGVFLIVRLGAFFALSPMAGAIISLVGAVTALVAALIALSQRDIKKVLAYSTVSQLGYMFIAAGAGAIYPLAYVAAIFHLVTHAFFKALLFMGAGSVIHGMHHAYPDKGEEYTQDMFNMGGLAKKMRITYLTFLAGSVALAGILPFAGFWSKDEILHGVYEAGIYGAAYGAGIAAMYWIAFGLALIAAGLTAFYTTRAVILTFHGEHRGTAAGYKKLHESPAVMWVPLLILAVLSLAGGIINVPGVDFLGHGLTGFLMDPVQQDSSILAVSFSAAVHHAHATADAYGWTFGALEISSLLLMLVSTVLAVGGAWYGYQTYTVGKERHVARFAAGSTWEKMRGISYAKFYFDEAYQKYILDPLHNLANILFVVVDRLLIDIFIAMGAQIIYHMSRVGRRIQTGLLSAYAMSFVVGVLIILAVVMFQMFYL